MIKDIYNINIDRAINLWDEALPLGNGKMGCLIYGDGPIRLSLDRVDLWDTRVHPNILEPGFNFANLVKLSTSKKIQDWEERDRLFERIYSEFSYPSKITAGRIELTINNGSHNQEKKITKEQEWLHNNEQNRNSSGVKDDEEGKISNVNGMVDIKNAIGRMKYDQGELELYLHATRFAGVAKIKGDFDLNLHIPDYISGNNNTDMELVGDGGTMNPASGMEYPKAEIKREDKFVYYIQKTKTDLEYGIFVYVVKKQNESEIYFNVATNKDCKNFETETKKQLKELSKIGYEELLIEHKKWWNDYWNKSSINIGDEFLEKTYYRSMYLFASCSRKGYHPMPLQGVWTADNDALPPWRGDYHHDTNTQLSYQSYLKANRLEEGEAFIDYLWKLKPQFEKVAKEFYQVDGLIVPGVSTIDGKPMGGWSQYALSPTMSIWTAQSFDEYYLYTGDRKFLKNRAFPFLEGVGKAISGLLVEKNGKLYLPLSTSPEIHDGEIEAYLEPNTNFDLALMRYLYERLKEYCKILGKDDREYEEILKRLDDIALIDGYIGLNKVERLKESHRHFSHLMCLYPLHLINYDTDKHKEIYHKAIEDIERLGMGMWVGFSYAMCSQIYAMAQMGNAAYEKLRQFADGFVAENGFHLNGDFQWKGYSTFHYRPFTLESLFGYCDALQEMLLQEHQGYLHIFPAIPKEWKKREIAFDKFRSYGGVLVSAKSKEGVLGELILDVPKTMTLKIKNTFGKEHVMVVNNNAKQIFNDDEGFFMVILEKGKNIIY